MQIKEKNRCRNRQQPFAKNLNQYEALRDYIDMNFDGLKDAVIDMLGGAVCEVDTGSFQNDMTSMKSKDDVLTLLIHLGKELYECAEKLSRKYSISRD